MAQNGTSKSHVWLWILLIVIAAVVIFAFAHPRSAVPIRAAQVTRQDISNTESTNGKVEPIEDFQAHAPNPGIIAQVYVHLGEQVRKGQQLIRMDSSDAANRLAGASTGLQGSIDVLRNMEQGGTQDELLGEHADLKNAEAEVRQATSSLASLQKLQAQGAASANEIALAQQRLATAQARVAQIKTRETGRYGSIDFAAQQAQIAQARANLAAAQSGYAAVDVRAPFAGTVYSLPVQQYDSVQAGEALLNVADLTRLRVRAYFDEPEIGQLAAGQPVTITWEAKPNQVWHGHVQQAPTTIITYGTRNVGECVITVDDARGDLLPNTNVIAYVTTARHDNVLSVPREALHTEGAINFVYRVINDHLVRTPVQIAPGAVVTVTRAEITGGLKEGDLVALEATTEVDLSNGLKVKVVE
jgi:HlyD family secretion protein